MKTMTYEIKGGFTKIDAVDDALLSISQFATKHGLYIQVLNGHMICGKFHLISAIEHALRAMNEKRMRTQSIEMEILLYASGERQLNYAIPKMGIQPGKANIAIIFLVEHEKKKCLHDFISLFMEKFHIHHDDSCLEPSIDKIRRWGFSDEELQTITNQSYEDLILEKVALVDIIK